MVILIKLSKNLQLMKIRAIRALLYVEIKVEDYIIILKSVGDLL